MERTATREFDIPDGVTEETDHMKVITKDNVDEATPWEPTDASTQATLDLDLTTLHHDFATEAGY